MEKKTNLNILTAKNNNEAIEQGYRYAVKGEWYYEGYDRYDHMPTYEGFIHLFTDRTEAEVYAEKNPAPFYVNKVKVLEYRLTYEEKKALQEKAEAEAKAKAEAKEQAKAEAMGMTIEQYKEYKKAVAGKKRHETAIRKAYEEIERLKKEIAYHEGKVIEYNEKVEG